IGVLDVLAVDGTDRGVAVEAGDLLNLHRSRRSLPARGDGRGEAGDGRVAEEEARVEPEPGLARPRRDLDDEDRVEAEFEEVVVDADAVDAEDLRGDLRQRGLGLVAGGDVRLAGGRRGVERGEG